MRETRRERTQRKPKRGLPLAVFGLTLAGAFAFLGSGSDAQSRTTSDPAIEIPRGLPESLWIDLIPEDNPVTAPRVVLGERLYFDKRLSLDNTVSCATCHDPAFALTDNQVTAVGIRNQRGPRNSPTVFNTTFNEAQFWDGRAPTLEAQAKLPLINPIEMGMPDHDAVVARVESFSEYGPLFEAAFGDPDVTIDRIAQGIAGFERTQLSGNSPFDRFIAGDAEAISEAARRGWELFRGEARCIPCHTFNASAPFFSDFKFHNIGVAAKDQDFSGLARRARERVLENPGNVEVLDELALSEGFSELGRFTVTLEPRDIGAFKTSMLRDVELTAPYFHDGSAENLMEVVKFYNDGGETNPNLSGGIRPLDLEDDQMEDLVEFLESLTSDAVRARAEASRPQNRQPAD